MTTMAKAIRVKDTAFGQDMLEVLAERQLERIGYQELDIAHSIQTLKEYLVKKLSHGNWRVDPGLCQPELRYLYPVYFDSARVLLAECVAEFFQTGKEIFAPADDIADGEMYLRLAADMDSRIAELKARFKATGDRKVYYSIQDLKVIQREHRKTAEHLLCRGERRRCTNREGSHT